MSVSTCFLNAHLTQTCLCLSVVSWRQRRATYGLPCRAPVYRGCPAWTHRCATGSWVTPWQRANPLCVLRGVVTSCFPCAHVPRVSRDVLTTVCRSCATENTYRKCPLWGTYRRYIILARNGLPQSYQYIQQSTHQFTHILIKRTWISQGKGMRQRCGKRLRRDSRHRHCPTQRAGPLDKQDGRQPLEQRFLLMSSQARPKRRHTQIDRRRTITQATP